MADHPPTLRTTTWMTNFNSSTSFLTLSTATVISKCLASTTISLENFLYAMFMVVVFFISVFGNVVVLLVVGISNSLKRRCTFYFIASLACSDLLVTICTIPVKISVKLHHLEFCLGLSACYVYILVDVCGNLASILNLLLVSFDRFVAIQMPYKYLVLLNSRNAKRLIVSIWTFAAVWSLVGIFHWSHSNDHQPSHHKEKLPFNSTHIHSTHAPQVPHVPVFSIHVDRMCINTNTYHYLFGFYGIYIPVLTIMTAVYLKILHVALKQIHKIKKHGTVQGTLQPLTAKNIPLVSNINECSLNAKELQMPKSSKKLMAFKRQNWSLRRELQATKSVAIVYLAFCVCWFPTCVITTIIHIDEHYFHRLQQRNMALFLTIYYLFVEILPVLNFMVNPLIYSFSSEHFRAAKMQLVRKLFKRSEQRSSFFDLSSRGRTITEENVQLGSKTKR